MRLLLGLDQGTSGTKAYLMDEEGRRLGLGYAPLARQHPRPDWTEQDPRAVADGATQAIALALRQAEASAGDILAIGIASQRDTDFTWDSQTGAAITDAITWQDLRTAPLVEEMKRWPLAGEWRRRLGYFPGPWCAALHLAWRARNQPEWREAVQGGRARIGMSAGWLLAALGRATGHFHDFSLVQKTGLWDFRRGEYWADWIDHLGLTIAGLPSTAPTLHSFGVLCLDGLEIPVTAMLGDQQAALFGHGCRRPGQAECTHGTVSFVKVVTGNEAPELEKLNIYHAWSLPARTGSLRPEIDHTYCLEADTTTSGAAVRWLATQVGILEDESNIDALARSVPDSGGVVFVPALTGLNTPYHDHAARGSIMGLSLGSSKGHIARALLEAIAFQVRAILETISGQTGLQVHHLSLGGGLSKSDLACQLQADLLGIPVVRPSETETTARGAALLAGLGAGVWSDPEDLPPLPGGGVTFEPGIRLDQREVAFERWQRAVAHVQAWGMGGEWAEISVGAGQ